MSSFAQVDSAHYNVTGYSSGANWQRMFVPMAFQSLVGELTLPAVCSVK